VKEIERKFLVRADLLPALTKEDTAKVKKVTQGYLSMVPPVVRVRLVSTSEPNDVPRAYMTVKSAGTLVREEIETEILPRFGFELMKLCPVSLYKFRRDMGEGWVVDHIPALDLWLAEIELDHEMQQFRRPAWLGREVTESPEFTSLALAQKLHQKLQGDGSVHERNART
jgi:adenylate cyclase